MTCLTRSRRAPLRGFTLIELLTVIAVMGVLFAMSLPTLHTVRQSACGILCRNNLRQIGIGLHGYYDAVGSFPPGGVEPRTPFKRKGRQLAWCVFLLPYIEEGSLYERLEIDEAFDAPENADAAATVLPIFVCPSAPDGNELQSGRGPCQYGGIYGERITGPNNPPKGVMLYDRPLKAIHIRDGLSTTLMISEDSGSRSGQWINGQNVFDQAYAINHAPAYENDIRSTHPCGANGLFCDGSVRFLAETMDLETLAAICTRSGGEIVQKP